MRTAIFNEEWSLDPSNNLKEICDYALKDTDLRSEFKYFAANGSFKSVDPSLGIATIDKYMKIVLANPSCRHGVFENEIWTHLNGEIRSTDTFKTKLTMGPILHFTEIRNEWNSVTYFYETERDFILFDWGTSA